MTRWEQATMTDMLLRLRTWRHRQLEDVYRYRRARDLWKHRALVQSERAWQAERKATRLERRNRALEDQLLKVAPMKVEHLSFKAFPVGTQVQTQVAKITGVVTGHRIAPDGWPRIQVRLRDGRHVWYPPRLLKPWP